MHVISVVKEPYSNLFVNIYLSTPGLKFPDRGSVYIYIYIYTCRQVLCTHGGLAVSISGSVSVIFRRSVFRDEKHKPSNAWGEISACVRAWIHA